MKSILGIILSICPTLAQAKWSSYICEITREAETVAIAYLNIDRIDEGNGNGTRQVWNKREFGSFSDEVVVESKNLKHTYFKGSRYSGNFVHGLGYVGTGPIYDHNNPTDSDQYIRCETIKPIFKNSL